MDQWILSWAGASSGGCWCITRGCMRSTLHVPRELHLRHRERGDVSCTPSRICRTVSRTFNVQAIAGTWEGPGLQHFLTLKTKTSPRSIAKLGVCRPAAVHSRPAPTQAHLTLVGDTCTLCAHKCTPRVTRCREWEQGPSATDIIPRTRHVMSGGVLCSCCAHRPLGRTIGVYHGEGAPASRCLPSTLVPRATRRAVGAAAHMVDEGFGTREEANSHVVHGRLRFRLVRCRSCVLRPARVGLPSSLRIRS